MKIAIWGTGKPVLDVIEILKMSAITIEYVKVDVVENIDDEFINSLNKEHIKYCIDSYPDMDLDMIFVINYNRIIYSNVIDKYLVVNYHLGLLPKWRGNSANGWGIINGENYVGFTIHKVNNFLDDGPIYYQYKYPYKEGETYYNAKIAMQEDMVLNLSDVLTSIIQNPELYIKFDDKQYVYCSKFKPTDGIIKDWNLTSDEIIRRFYVFSRPLGSGLKFIYKDNCYEILSFVKIENFAISKGILGGVINKDNGSVWVKTADTAISISKLKFNDEIYSADSLLKIGQRL